jgi:PAS domain S-box-containing protein
MPKAHILIVEDDRIVAEDTKITLEKLGFGISGMVPSGEDTLERVEAEPPDLVLMDIELEGEMDGIEAAARIRDRFNIPVVYVTGYADEDVLERAKVTEPFAYIVKPFEDRELNSVIEIALYKHKMETKLKESARKLQISNDELERRVKERTAELQESNERLVDEMEERKGIEKALRESEGRFRQFMDNFPGVAFISDPGRCVIYANKAYSDFYKLNLEELINHKFEEYVSPESIAKAKEQDKIVVSENRSLAIEETMPDKTGSREWYTCKFPIHQQNKPVLIGGLGIEITDRKRSEKALKKFKAISDNANYGMAISDLEGKLEYVNEYFAGIHGYSSNELIGRNLAIFHNEEQLKMVAEVIKELIERGNYAPKEIWHSHKDGFSFPMLMSGMVIKGENKDQHRLAATSIDITDLKKLQAQLVRSERLAATGQLAASIAHEINSPLQAVTFMLSSMGERWKNEKELIECIRILQGAFRSIRDTVKNLLDLNCPGKDEKQQTDVNRVIEKTTALIRIQLNKSGVTLNPDLSPRIPGLTASPQGLSHVFLNLFNNAIEAITGISKPDGGETGFIGRGEINVKTNLRKGHVVIKVTDNGPGIPKEDLEHIFDPFYTRKKRMGLGVGLSVCHDIVNGHGGTITAENGLEGGAVFTITLPLDC